MKKRILAGLMALSILWSVAASPLEAFAAQAEAEKETLTVEPATNEEAASSEEAAAQESEQTTASESEKQEKQEAPASQQKQTEEKSAQTEKTAKTAQPAKSANNQAKAEKKTATEQKTPERIEEEERKELTASITDVAGKTYTVTVAYDKSAGIPDNAVLSVKEALVKPEKMTEEEEKERPYDFEYFLSQKEMDSKLNELSETLEIAEEDYVFFKRILNVTLTAGGKKIQPKSEVEVRIETDAVNVNRSDSIEIARYEKGKCAALWVDNYSDILTDDELKTIENLKKDEKFTRLTKLTTYTDRLSELALMGVATEMESWTVDGVALTVSGPRSMNGYVDNEQVEEQEQGVEVLDAFSVRVESQWEEDPELEEQKNAEHNVALWVSANTEEQKQDELSTLTGCKLKDSEPSKKLFGDNGTSKPAQFLNEEGVALLLDTGYRSQTLEQNDVTVDGMMPKGTTAQVKEVSNQYSEVADAQEDKTAVAAYDISLAHNKEEYQPDEDHPVSVTIANDAIAEDSALEVWNVQDDGTVKVVDDVKVEGNTVSFDADGTNDSNVYMVVEVTIQQTVTASDGSEYLITVTYDNKSGIPEDAELVVSEIKENDDGYSEYVEKSAEKLGNSVENVQLAKAFDITLRDPDTGKEYQPTQDVKVSIQLMNEKLNNYENVDVVHFHGEGEDQVAVMDSTVNGDTVEFATDGFSVYVVCGYTVDFHWGDYTYQLPGGETILLSELMTALAANATEDTEKLNAILKDMTQIQDVTFSDQSLLKVSHINTEAAKTLLKARVEDQRSVLEAEMESGEGDAMPLTLEELDAQWKSYALKEDWTLTSLKSFDTDEKLTITLKDGSEVKILVTDPPVSFNHQGLVYQAVANNSTNVKVVGFEKNYSGIPTIPATIYKNGTTYTVTDLTYFGSGTNLRNKHIFFEQEMLEKMANGATIGLPEMVVKLDDAVEQAILAQGFVAGEKNDTADQLVWKKAVYHPETNSITYEIKYFQPMKQSQPLDFIFGIDQSGTMCTHDATVYNIRAPRVIWMMAMLQRTAYELVSQNGEYIYNPDDGEHKGYDNKVAFVPWGSSKITPVKDSDFLSNAEEIDTWFQSPAVYAHAAEGTNHGYACDALADAAALSMRNHRTPIVIYMSDFVSHAGSTQSQRNRLRLASFKTYSFVVFNNGHTEFSKGWTNSGAYEADDPALFMGIFKNIVLDAIGYYMKGNIAVTDTMPDAISNVTATQTDATGAAAQNPGTVSPESGKVTWQLGNQNPLLPSGTVHTETFTAQLDKNTIYSGAMPTNDKAKVTVNGKEVNSITPKADDPDNLHKGGDITFLLGRLDKKAQIDANSEGVPSKLTQGVQFTLTRVGENDTIKTTQAPDGLFTTDGNGSFVVPYKDASDKVIFGLRESFVLHEVGDSVTEYNDSDDHDEKLVAPDKDWIITVSNAGIITVAPQSGASQTPRATIADAVNPNPPRVVLWNQIVVPATLIPVTVQKVWQDDGRTHYPVPFTIYGVPQGMPYEERPLTAYKQMDTSSQQVKYITGNQSELTWTMTVYVPDKEDENGTEYQYFNYDVISGLNGYNYHYADENKVPTEKLEEYDELDGAKDGVITHNQQYSYVIREHEMAYEDGYYSPTYTNNANPGNTYNHVDNAVDPFSLIAYDNGTGQTTVTAQTAANGSGTIDNVNVAANFQFHIAMGHFEYKDTELSQADLNTYFAFNNHKKLDDITRVRNFFTKIGEVTVEFSKVDGGVTKNYTLKFKPDVGHYFIEDNDIAAPAAHDAYTFRGIALPSDWADNYTSVRRDSNTRTWFRALNGITYNKITMTSNVDSSKKIIVYSNKPSDTKNKLYWNWTKYDQLGDRPELEVMVSGERWHRITSSNTSQSLVRQEYTISGSNPAPLTDTSFNHNNIQIGKQPVLGISNEWKPNKLEAVKIIKNWESTDPDPAKLQAAIEAQKVTDPKDPDYGKYRMEFSLNGTTEKGGTKTVPIFESENAAWSTGKTTGALTETDSTKTRWEGTVYVPKYDVLNTYSRIVKPDYTEEETVQAYQYENASFVEGTLAVQKDDDGEKRGEWNDPSDSTEFEWKTETPETGYGDEPDPEPEGGWKSPRFLRMQTLDTNLDVLDITLEYQYLGPEGKIVREKLVLERNTDTWMGFNNLNVNAVRFNGPQPIGPDRKYQNITLEPTDTNKFISVTLKVKNYFPSFVYSVTYNTEQLKDTFSVFDLMTGTPQALFSYQGINLRRYTWHGDLPDEGGSGTGGTTTPPEVIKTPTFTVTNTFTPYKEVQLRSVFSDRSRDIESTKAIKKVSYIIRQGDTIVRETTPVAVNVSEGGVATGVHTIYLPEGEYSITQRYYLNDETSGYELDGEQDAYTTIWSETNQGENGDIRYNLKIDSDRVINFVNDRKELPIRVQMVWDPALESTEDPLQESGKTLSYGISYNSANSDEPTEFHQGDYSKTVNGGTTEEKTDAAFELEYARQVNDHNAHIPTYSVREGKTDCTLNRKNMEEALPEYALEVTSQEQDGKLVFTINASIHRFDIRISKAWIEVEDGFSYPASLTFTLKRDDDKPIYGTNDRVKTVIVSNKGAPNAWTAGEAIFNDIPILRSAGADATAKYVLTESDSGKTYYTTYVDLTKPTENKFEQNTKADEEYASFKLNDGGIFIEVQNATKPYICKIVETFEDSDDVVEHPFRTLNKAVAWARNPDNVTMDANNPVKIQMLVDYTIPFDDKVELNQSGDNIIITTAATSGGTYNFTPTFTAEQGRLDDDGNRAILKRGDSSDNNASLFTVSHASAALSTEDIIFDGGAVYTKNANGSYNVAGITANTPGGIVLGTKGAVTIKGGTTMRNSNVGTGSNWGGAAYSPNAADGATITIDSAAGKTIEFLNCTAGNGGAIKSYLKPLTVTNNGTLNFVNCKAKYGGALFTEYNGANISITNTGTMLFDDCDATSGVGGAIGAYKSTSNVTITNTSGSISFKDCSTSSNGGAIYADGAVSISGDGASSFTNCVGANGGGIYGKSTVSVTNGSFTGCSAGTDGGGIYSAGAATLTKVTFGKANTADSGCYAKLKGGSIFIDSGAATLTECNFYYSKVGAADNLDTRGGGVAYNGSNELRILGCVFDHCVNESTADYVAKGNGGAVYVQDKATKLTIDKSGTRRSSFTNCSARRFGGAVHWETNGGTVEINNADFANCHTKIKGGGAVFADSTATTISNCSFSGCYSDSTDATYGGGGAVYTNADNATVASTIAISDTTFSDCTVKKYGGAIQFNSTGTTATLTNVSIDGKKDRTTTDANAELGGAIYSKGNLTIKQTGTGKSEIKNCSASDANGGAINVNSGSVSFEGDVVVYDNLSTKSDQQVQANVVLDQNNDTTINTTDIGLGADAHIGVFVTGNNAAPYTTHGQYEQDFGTHGTSTANFNAFTNDRNGLYGEASGTNRIRWQSYLLKLTDDSGELLFYKDDSDQYHPAIFNTLKEGFAAAAGTLYIAGAVKYVEVEEPVKVCLLKNYTQPGTDTGSTDNTSVANTASRDVTFTTAGTEASTSTATVGGQPYVLIFNPGSATDKDTATITRGYTGDSMFTHNSNSGNTLTIANLVLDGGNVATDDESTRNGGIVNVAKGTLSMETDAVLQNSRADKGGAVYVTKGATMTMSTGTINGNTATEAGAGIYVEQGGVLKLSGNPNFGGSDLKGGNGTDKDEIQGTRGNFLTTPLSNKKNGGKNYSKTRQDIYLAEVGTESTADITKYTPASLVITDDITSGDGTIWVWAANQYRYKQLMPFAKLDTGVKFAEKPATGNLEAGTFDAAHLKAFRNAQDDETTENGTDTYLFGTIEGEVEKGNIIYWTGNAGYRKVILRKVDGSDYTSLKGAKFNVYKGSGSSPYIWKDRNDTTNTDELKDKESLASGVFWVGTLPYGVYYLEETKAPDSITIMKSDGTTETRSYTAKWFFMVVGDDTVPESRNGVYMSGGYPSRDDAKQGYNEWNDPTP